MEINYCLKKGKGKGNLYLPSFVVTLFCRRALMSSRSYVAALLCRRALMSHALLSRALFAARFCRDTLANWAFKRGITWHTLPSEKKKLGVIENFGGRYANSNDLASCSSAKITSRTPSAEIITSRTLVSSLDAMTMK
jgi:hypothetical protein